MPSTVEEKIVKIRKLLALAGSSNPHEAALAKKRADELLAALSPKDRARARKPPDAPKPSAPNVTVVWATSVIKTRELLGMSQARFGELLGVHRTTVSAWERGDVVPTEYQQAMIARFYRAGLKRRDIGEIIERVMPKKEDVTRAVFEILKAAFKR